MGSAPGGIALQQSANQQQRSEWDNQAEKNTDDESEYRGHLRFLRTA
jgi:hypothetical protein